MEQPQLLRPSQGHKTRTLQDILDEFDPIDQVTFQAIEIEPHKPTEALLPAQFPEHCPPVRLLCLVFFYPELFRLITKHTN